MQSKSTPREQTEGAAARLTLKPPVCAAASVADVSEAQSAARSHPQMNASLYDLAANAAADGSTPTGWARLRLFLRRRLGSTIKGGPAPAAPAILAALLISCSLH